MSESDVTIQFDFESLKRQLRGMTDAFIDATMQDPDIVNRSDDFKAGYDKGFREAIAAAIAALLVQKRAAAR